MNMVVSLLAKWVKLTHAYAESWNIADQLTSYKISFIFQTCEIQYIQLPTIFNLLV